MLVHAPVRNTDHVGAIPTLGSRGSSKGKTQAFQAWNIGSIPLPRSSFGG